MIDIYISQVEQKQEHDPDQSQDQKSKRELNTEKM